MANKNGISVGIVFAPPDDVVTTSIHHQHRDSGRLILRPRRNEAQAALAAVYGTYTEGFTTPDLVDAAAQLNSLA